MFASQSRIQALAVAALAVASALVHFAGCGLDPHGTAASGDGAPCSAAVPCDDGNPCTTDTCTQGGVCESVPVPDGVAGQQAPGDCVRVECQGGGVVAVADEQDIPDDAEDCTVDSCSGAMPVHTAKSDGDPCLLGMAAGACQGGVCTVECGSGLPGCDDGNPCTEDACNAAAGQCVFTDLSGIAVPGATQDAGDCRQRICVMGVDTSVPDDTDIPDDSNTCTDDVCAAGVPSNPPTATGAPCTSGGTVCSGMGACVACNLPADCNGLPPNDECQTRTCITNQCGQSFTMSGTPVAVQLPGDCMQVVCDGAGQKVPVVDDSDVPVDGNDCTGDICMNGIPSHPDLPMNAPCGVNGMLYCDGAGTCVGCNTAGQCGTDTFCRMHTCNSQQCGQIDTPAGTPLPTGQTPMDCKVLACDGMGNEVTAVDANDIPVDGKQCTLDTCSPQGDPSNPPAPVLTPCSEDGGQVCDGAGHCKKDKGQPCGLGGECQTTFCVDSVCCDSACSLACKACNVTGSTGICTNVPKYSEDLPGCSANNSCDGSGTCKKDDGQSCGVSADCTSSFCVDAVCCNTACSGICQACTAPKNGTSIDGICGNIAGASDPDNECADQGGPSCANNGLCDGLGACQKYASGTECAPATCAGTILHKADTCNGMGVCIDNMTADCTPYTCDSGACKTSCTSDVDCASTAYCLVVACLPKKLDGQACVGGNQCTSGNCVDGVCCDVPCAGICRACSAAKKGAGADGVCSDITAGLDPDNECDDQGPMACADNGVCSGTGACQKYPSGTVCVAASCVNATTLEKADTCNGMGICVDNMMQNCSPYFCSMDACFAACTTDADCVSGFYCNGSSCLSTKPNGQVCSTGSDCTSGNCVDGVCCDTPCTGPCVACSAAKKGSGVNGTCGAIANGTDPDNDCMDNGAASCMNDGACSGSGACRMYAIGTVCAPPSCGSGPTLNLADTCNGMGMCTDGGTQDCGLYLCAGGACPTTCSADADCVPTAYCTMMMGSCTAKGGTGAMCGGAHECISGVCTAGTCQAPSCTDHVENGSETDVDCGGSCPDCLNGKGCSVVADCKSGVCLGGICQPSCTDGLKNGTETDVDCGGSCAANCGNGKACMVSADCTNGTCNGGFCQNATCNNGMQNGGNGETDIDCGGTNCKPCGSNMSCNVAGDCQSGVCTGPMFSETCKAPTCTDLVKNGTETDIDCGGSCATNCAAGNLCLVDADCASNKCSGAGLCTP